MSEKRAVIISGGSLQKEHVLSALRELEEERKECSVRLIAADRGLDFCLDNEIIPDLAVGDFDSVSEETGKKMAELEADGSMEVLSLMPEKDDSDTQSALVQAIREGCGKIRIFGATGTRVDHLLANLGLLLLAKRNGAEVILEDAWNRISLVESGARLKKRELWGENISFFSLGEDVEGLTLIGFHYPLTDYHLRFSDSGLTVSNVVEAEEAEVWYRSGELFMIQSRD